jgi:hypothetical protein
MLDLKFYAFFFLVAGLNNENLNLTCLGAGEKLPVPPVPITDGTPTNDGNYFFSMTMQYFFHVSESSENRTEIEYNNKCFLCKLACCVRYYR